MQEESMDNNWIYYKCMYNNTFDIFRYNGRKLQVYQPQHKTLPKYYTKWSSHYAYDTLADLQASFKDLCPMSSKELMLHCI